MLAAPTATSVPWWYVAALAGSFTILGALLTLAANLLVARRKNRLDDFRRFEPDVIATYILLDRIVGILHENDPDDRVTYHQVFWENFPLIIDAMHKLEVIASHNVSKHAVAMWQAACCLRPDATDKPDAMSSLVGALTELRLAIRRELRIPTK